MIRNKIQKLNDIKTTIRTRIFDINVCITSDPTGVLGLTCTSISEHSLRLVVESVNAFVSDDYNLEMLYATLVAWDMNSRG